MKKELNPSWTKQQKAEGEKQKRSWEDFFSKTGAEEETPFSHPSESAKIAKALAQHETELMGYANVVGVATGIQTKKGQPTGEPCVVVFVQKKIERDKLNNEDIIPSQIDGVLVDVVEVGKIDTLPL